MSETVAVKDLPALAGRRLEPSAWIRISQERVNRFADATNDHQFIHVDPEKAAQTAFGGPIAHGFLTLSLLPHLLGRQMISPEGLVLALNYGSDKVRFAQAVPVGSRIRAHQRILDVSHKGNGRWLVRIEATVEIENRKKPALVAELLIMWIIR